MNDLLYSIGLDVSDLKTSARLAKEQADEIKKGFKGFKDVLEAGGVAAAVYGFFRDVIDYAEKATAPIDSNVAAVKRFGASLTAAKNGALEAGATVLGFFNKAGETMGSFAQVAIEGTQNAWSAIKRFDLAGIFQGYKKAVDDVRTAHYGELDALKAEAEAAEKKKRIGDELKRIGTELASIEKQRNDLANEGLTKQETVNFLVEQVRAARAAEAAATGDVLVKQSAKLATQQAELALAKALHDLDKENLELAKQADAAAEKADQDRVKAFNQLGEAKAKQLDYERSKLDLMQQEQLLAADQLKIQKELESKTMGDEQRAARMNDLLEVSKNLDEVRLKLAEKRKDAEEKLLEFTETAPLEKLISKREELASLAHTQYKEEGRVSDELQHQLDTINAAIDARTKFIALGRTGDKDNTRLSDRELAEKISNLQDGLNQDRIKDPFGKYAYLSNEQRQDLSNAQFEQNRRATFRLQYSQEGEAAFSHYSAFLEQQLRNYIRPEDEKRNQQQASDIKEISDRLAGRRPAFSGG